MAHRSELLDTQLVTLWLDGDRSAAEQLIDRHFKTVERFFRNKVFEDHQDLVQQTFAICLQSGPGFRGASSFQTFLLGIANNVLRNHVRARTRDRERHDWGEVTVLDLGPGPSTLFQRNQEHTLLLNALRRVPVELQVVLELYYWDELSAREIGEVLGCGEEVVRTRLRKGKKLLARRLEDLSSSDTVLERTHEDLRTLEAMLEPDGVARAASHR